MSSYKSFFNPTNVLVMAALLALVLFRHSLFPETSESTEVKQLMGKMDAVIGDMQTVEAEPEKSPVAIDKMNIKQPAPIVIEKSEDESNARTAVIAEPNKPQAINEVDANAALTLWQTARRAAWDGNSDAAIENYRTLIKLQPGNYDAYGEMGNVLLEKGDNESAVEAYSQAAMLLSQSGYPQAAWHVMNIVVEIDKTKAEELHQTLYGVPLPANQ